MTKDEKRHCCEGCWEFADPKCPDLVKCLLFRPRGVVDTMARERVDSRVNALKRVDVSTPVIYVGAGTCGLGAGAAGTLEAVQEWIRVTGTKAQVIQVGCIGLCAEEPLLDVQLPGKARLSLRHVTRDKVVGYLDSVFANEIPAKGALMQFSGEGLENWPSVPTWQEHPFFAPQERIVLKNCGLVDPESIGEYIARGGYQALATTLTNLTRTELCTQVEKSGLRGRGGGGFPTGKKWRFALDTPADQKFLVCNADEGDPGAFMDRAVIEGDPHRLLEGMAIAAYAIGASKAYVYIRAEYPLAIARLNEAIKQAHSFGLLGENILDSGFNLHIIIKQGAGAFVCGEETALIASIEGKRGMPRPRPPYPAVQGLFGKPTVINNVETLSNLPEMFTMGVEAFAAMGTATSKGSKVFALSGKVCNTGLVEVRMGTTVRKIVEEIGGGVPDNRAFKAVQIGGPSGGCIPASHLDTVIDYESLKEVGAMMGSGGLVVMDEDNCMVDVARFFMDFIQKESCGKCIPCREGTRRMLEILNAITQGRRSEKGFSALHRFQGILQLEQLAKVIQDTSLCGLGQSAPNPVLSTLRWFREEYEEHIFNRHCASRVCKELLEYTIDPDACTGCTLCARKCPTEAIMGAKKSPHYVIQERCIGCGSCLEVCRAGAVRAQ